MGLFKKIKEGLKKTRDSVVSQIDSMLKSFTKIDEELFEELTELLVMGDVGIQTAEQITDELRVKVKKEGIKDPKEITLLLQEVVADMLRGDEELKITTKPSIILVIGVNGVGKTTTIGKLANNLKKQGKSVLLAAADTFRAAAADQLKEWANRANVDIVMGAEGSDPGSVLYDAISSAKNKNADILLCDTAGRLHNKKNLMEELKKLDRIIEKEYNGCRRENFIVLDATTGQNALAQARQFKECTDITGVILTKMDGSAKGGIAIAIQSELGIPVKYIGVGEQIDDLQKFDSHQFVEALFEENGEDITSNIELGE